jgi:hypothetical protein
LAERRLAIAALFQLLDDIVGTAQRSASGPEALLERDPIGFTFCLGSGV